MTELSRRTRIAAWVAAGVLAGLGAGVAVAQFGVAGAAPTPSPTTSADPRGGPPGFRDGPFYGMGPGMGFGMRGRMLHGEATLKTRGGDVKTVAMQTGTISAIDGATLTVGSSDDFTRDYAVDDATRIRVNGARGALSDLENGDTVHVVAVRDGSAWHAVAVMDGAWPHPMLGMTGRFGPGPLHQRFERHWQGPAHRLMMRPPATRS